jgi:hypothetical protein
MEKMEAIMGSFGSRGGLAHRRHDVAPPEEAAADGPQIIDLRRPLAGKAEPDRESPPSHS